MSEPIAVVVTGPLPEPARDRARDLVTEALIKAVREVTPGKLERHPAITVEIRPS